MAPYGWIDGAAMADVTYRLEICGRVQGVFYRGSMAAQAESLGLRGWVRNCLDGSVEAVIQGVPYDVGRMLEWARCGPPGAVVTSVDIYPASGDFVGFERRETV